MRYSTFIIIFSRHKLEPWLANFWWQHLNILFWIKHYCSLKNSSYATSLLKQGQVCEKWYGIVETSKVPWLLRLFLICGSSYHVADSHKLFRTGFCLNHFSPQCFAMLFQTCVLQMDLAKTYTDEFLGISGFFFFFCPAWQNQFWKRETSYSDSC